MTILQSSWNLSKLYSSISKHMTILHWSKTYQNYSVLFQSIWQSHVDQKLIKAIQFYFKTYENLTLIANLSKLFSSIPKYMTILHWSETYQSYSVLFQNECQSYLDRKLTKPSHFYSKTYDNLMLMGKLIKVIQFYFKTCDSLTLIEKLMKAIQFYFKPYGTLTLIRKLIKAIQFYCKTYENLTMIWNLLKLFSSIPKHMRILSWSGTD